MANYQIWMLEASNITVGDGLSLDATTDGDGSHLVGSTLTLDSASWLEVNLRDTGQDNFFDDNDSTQSLAGAQTIDGTKYTGNIDVAAEYQIVLLDPNTGIEYTAVAFNVYDGATDSYSVEGLSFVGPQGAFPPVGVELQIVSATQGPGDNGQDPIPAEDFVFPICFTPGTRVRVPGGNLAIETVATGDIVLTRDNGPQQVRWLGKSYVSADLLAAASQYVPVRICKDAFGAGRPVRDMLVSQQHRVVLTGWRAELWFGEEEVLVAAKHLVNGGNVQLATDVEEVIYLHLLFDRHEIVFADGIEAESFRPGPASLAALSDEARAELHAIYPDLADAPDSYGDPARALLRRWEGELLVG